MRNQFFWYSYHRKTLAGALVGIGIAVLLATVLPAPAAAREIQLNKCINAPSSWTPQEVWVWKRLCVPGVADLNTTGRFGPPADVHKLKSWSTKRALRSSFIETILTDARYSDILANRTIIISGAWFRSPIHLDNSSISTAIFFDNSRFDKEVNLNGADISSPIGFRASTLGGRLELDTAKVDGSIFLNEGSTFQRVSAIGAQVVGGIIASKSTFEDELELGTAKVDGSIFLDEGSTFQRVKAIGAQVVGDVIASKSTFEDELELDTAKVDGNIFLHEGSTFQGVSLGDAEVGGFVHATESNFRHDLNLYRAKIEGSVFLYESQFATAVICSGATIGGVLTLSDDDGDSTNGAENPKWGGSARIDLEGSTVRAIDDAKDAWPGQVWLAGLVMQQGHGQIMGPGEGIVDRSTSWYLDWLSRDRGFSRESYKHLEVLLRNNGRNQVADDIAIARMNEEHASEGMVDKAVGKLHRYTVGYGYQPELAIYWIVALVIIGAGVARRLPESTLESVPSRLVLSAQRLIPLIDFGKGYNDVDVTGKDVPAGVRRYFYFHAICGYVLAAFLIATLARVTAT